MFTKIYFLCSKFILSYGRIVYVYRPNEFSDEDSAPKVSFHFSFSFSFAKSFTYIPSIIHYTVSCQRISFIQGINLRWILENIVLTVGLNAHFKKL